MSERFKVDKFIEGCPVGYQIIDSYVEELVKEGKTVEDVTVDITDNGMSMTMRECCDILNSLYEENMLLLKLKDDVSSNELLDSFADEIIRLRKQNNELIKEVMELRDKVEKCRLW